MRRRPVGVSITEEEIAGLHRLYEAKLSMRETSRQSGISYRTVERWFEIFRVLGAAKREKKELPKRHYVGSFEI